MNKVIIFLLIIILFESCKIFCRCNDKIVYDYAKMLNTDAIKPSSYVFPTIDEINMEKIGKYYIFNDTMLRLYPDLNTDTSYRHFFLKLKCQFGKVEIETAESETF